LKIHGSFPLIGPGFFNQKRADPGDMAPVGVNQAVRIPGMSPWR